MMKKKVNRARYFFAPLFRHNNHFALGFACLVLLVVLPAVTCHAQEALFSTYSHDAYLEYCNAAAFEQKYSASACWSCDIVAILMDVMINVIQNISSTALRLAKIILIYGSALWLAMFFLKTLSSATAQDPSQTLTTLFTFMFKVAFVYVMIIDFGFANLIEWIVNPLLSIGIDIGSAFGNWSGGA